MERGLEGPAAPLFPGAKHADRSISDHRNARQGWKAFAASLRLGWHREHMDGSKPAAARLPAPPRSAVASSHWSIWGPTSFDDAIGVDNPIARSRAGVVGVQPPHALADLQGLAAEEAVASPPDRLHGP